MSSKRPLPNSSSLSSSLTTRKSPQAPFPSTSDFSQLASHYQFLPPASSTSDPLPTTWQQRMSSNYSTNLYKEYGIIDFTTITPHIITDQHNSVPPPPPPQIGIRWRTKAEVENHKGFKCCGNRRCPGSHPDISHPILKHVNLRYGNDFNSDWLNNGTMSKKRSRWDNIRGVGNGDTSAGLITYELPFSYVEGGASKMCLVKIKLCEGCSVLLFCAKELTGGKDSKKKKIKKEKKEDTKTTTTTTLLDRAISHVLELKNQWKAEESIEKNVISTVSDEINRARMQQIVNASNEEKGEDNDNSFVIDRSGVRNELENNSNDEENGPAVELSEDEQRLFDSLDEHEQLSP